jgi:hypothetical protein
MWNKVALAAICSLLALAQTTAAMADEADDDTEEDAEVEASFMPFGVGGGGPFFSALLINPAGDAEFGMLYGGKGFTYPLSWLRISGVGFGGGFGYGKEVGGGFGMGGIGIDFTPRDGNTVEVPVGIAFCFGGGEQTVEIEDEATGETWTDTEGGFIFMPMASTGVEFNPIQYMKIGLTFQFLYAVANPESFWGFGGSLWLAFGQIWPEPS